MRDELDRITHLDRLKELIKVKGLQVAPTEVEDVLLDHPERLVKDACVMGVVGPDGTSVFPRAWVVLSEEAKRRDEKEVFEKLDTFVRERLSRYKHLDGGIEVVESVSVSFSGLDRVQLMNPRFRELRQERC